MANQGFYFDNMFRAYPFLDSTLGMDIPEETVLDFNCFILSEVGYVAETSKVWLYKINREGSYFTFSFACDAPDLSGKLLEFTKTLDDKEVTYIFSSIEEENTDLKNIDGGYSSGFECANSILWEGYIIIGNLSKIASIIDEGESVYDYAKLTQVEPSLIIDKQKNYMQSINIANKIANRVTIPEGCSESSSSSSSSFYQEYKSDIVAYQTCISGEVFFSNGYSCDVSISSIENSVNFIPDAFNSDKGKFCGNEPEVRYPSNLVPGIRVGIAHPLIAGSVLYSGGPTCPETLKSINGISGKRLWILAGTGISITENNQSHSLGVSATLSGLAVCSNLDMVYSSASLNG